MPTLTQNSGSPAVFEVSELAPSQWPPALIPHSAALSPRGLNSSDLEYWKDRLFLRRYRFPATESADNDWAIKIEHEGIGFWFPLSTPNLESAAAKARQIHQTLMSQGWEAVCTRFPRELIVNFEWSVNPILWTYTTIHTLVEPGGCKHASTPTPAAQSSCPVIVLESEAGIRRALQWCVNQQPGFLAVGCNAPEHLPGMLKHHKPALLLINRSLAERTGVELGNGPTALKQGLIVLGYSVSVDGDQMFVSTPGGAEGYMLKRIKPSRLLDPISHELRLPHPEKQDFPGAVNAYFKRLLLPHAGNQSSPLSRLTPRENDVLGLLSKGCVDKEIAHTLNISIWTVHGHIKKIFERLSVRTRTEAVVRYLEK